MTQETLKEMTLLEHLVELRKRLVVAAISIVIGAVICFSFSGLLFEFLTSSFYRYFPGSMLIGTGPAEAFVLKLKVSFFAGCLLMSPILFYQFWLFIAPGLYEPEKKLAIPFVASGTFLFLLGVVFCHEVVLPFAFEFFYQEYKSINVTPTIRISEHLATLMQALLGFGIVFEMPVLAFFLGRLGVITHHTLINGARYAVVIIFIISAVLTPPDALTQLLMAGPLILLYGLSILIVKYSSRTKRNPDQALQPVNAPQPPLP